MGAAAAVQHDAMEAAGESHSEGSRELRAES
eukprot:CAMPEP_0173252556 /NCGR_PEP_ID=MMETSP1142-20121109/20802_1 /TAXON_ID=483371 /ORGANISM="non described non described, Strain CCMP2298" /LENGTH=30 /DNA_ID= /DNA_START= /DNA_END= /DNA_ORIENTATION=